MNEIKLPDRIVTEETRAEARRQLIELVATLPLEKRVAMAQAIHELAVVYVETAAVRAHQGLADRAIAYNKCAEEMGTISGGLIANLQNSIEEMFK